MCPKILPTSAAPPLRPMQTRFYKMHKPEILATPLFRNSKHRWRKTMHWSICKNFRSIFGPGLWQNGQTNFDFSQLIDLNNGEGQARFNAQFFRSNIDPTELYVMSLTNSTAFRIKANETGYNGLYITGDWIFNGFNAGCIEATVMSGMQAANAVAGLPLDIPGENDNL